MREDNVFGRLRKRLSANGPGMTLGVIAVLLALTGGAFAAGGALTAKQKKEVKAIAKAEAKKTQGAGPAGPQGPTGAAGSKGDKGDQGIQGVQGAPGDQGDPGVAGESPEGFPFEGTSEPAGNPCSGNGGIEYEVEGSGDPHYVCNGKEGSPWTLTGNLPTGKTETGTWAFTGTTADTSGIRVPLSFAIPTATAFAAGNVHWQEEANFTDFDGVGDGTVGCAGGTAAPSAPSGHLCVYINTGENPIPNATFDGIYKPGSTGNGTNRSGASLQFNAPTGASFARGTFAVTAP